MCDYSLMGIPNRLAESGEKLLVYKFSTGSLGFASAVDLSKARNGTASRPRRGFWSSLWQNFFASPRTSSVPAVCIPPGSRLFLQDIPERLQEELQVGPAERVVFTELTAVVNHYRDGIQFTNGRHVLLQKLDEGQRAEVLDLSSSNADEQYAECVGSRVTRRM